jgi:hypothetical protein
MKTMTLDTKTVTIWFGEESDLSPDIKHALKLTRLAQLKLSPSHCRMCHYRNLRLLDPSPYICRN